jgi:hypothetical protein
MSVNKFKPHVYIIPEDRADEQIANGFVLHDQVKQRQVQILRCADGWSDVLHRFQNEYIQHLQRHKDGHVIMLVDFDGQFDSRRARFHQVTPEELKSRVFVIGVKQTPELLKQELGKKFEDIGLSLADDCQSNTEILWSHDHLKHNDPDRQRMVQIIRPILFGS